MNIRDIDNYLNNKILDGNDFIRCTFYEIRVKLGINENEVNDFLALAKNKLENNGYDVFFTGAIFKFKGIQKKVEDNEMIIAIKEEL